MKRHFILIGLVVCAALVALFASGRQLRGDVLSSADIAWNLKQQADTNDDGVLTTKEIRLALVYVVRRVVQQGAEGDVNGDGATNRADIRAATRAFRDLLAAVCGNHEREAGEQCDDGNSVDGDGCSDVCTESFTCGNGVREGSEQCDDGNTADADGCSAVCLQSFLWHPETLGFDTWYDVRTLCDALVSVGMTNWVLPTITDLELIKPEIERLGLTGQIWTATHGPSSGHGQTTFRTWDLGLGTLGNEADPDREFMSGLCVQPTSVFYSCTDGDRPSVAVSYDTYIRSAIFTGSTLRLIQGTQETMTRDACDGTVLREQLCPFVVGQGYEVSVDCPYGCADGACFRDPPEGFAWPYPATVTNGAANADGTVIGSGVQSLGAFTIHSTDPVDITQMTFSIDLHNVRLRSMTPPDESQIRRRNITVTSDRTGAEVALTCSDADSLDEIVGPGVRRLRCAYGGSVPTRVGPNASTTFTLHGELIPIPGFSDASVRLSWGDFNDPFFKPDTDIGIVGSESNVLLINRRVSKQQYYLPALQIPLVNSTAYTVVP